MAGVRDAGRVDDGRLPPPYERLTVLGDDREAGVRRELLDVGVRIRERGRRRGHPVLDAQLVRPLLAGEPARERGLHAREEEGTRQYVLVLGDQDRRFFVGRDQDRRPADAAADPQQPVDQLPGLLLAGGRPDERPLQVP
ncbi:hypothetical protein GCM10009612_24690 [Streptomyces beijiangensis]